MIIHSQMFLGMLTCGNLLKYLLQQNIWKYILDHVFFIFHLAIQTCYTNHVSMGKSLKLLSWQYKLNQWLQSNQSMAILYYPLLMNCNKICQVVFFNTCLQA